MKIIRVMHQGVPRWAVLKGESYQLMFGDLFRLPADVDARPHPYDPSRVLCPVQPTKIVAVGLNYADHVEEMGNQLLAPASGVSAPKIKLWPWGGKSHATPGAAPADSTPPSTDPVLFLKPPSSILAPGAAIVLPPESDQMEHEAELAVVLKTRIHRVTPEAAQKAVWGYLCCNDVTARDLQKKDGQWTRAKGFDTFCPVGPWIDTEFKEGDQKILCRVNGEVRQSSTLGQRIRNAAQLLSFASQVMTLEPHDVLITGTPKGVGPLKAGDTVEVEIEGLGILRNTVRLP